MNPLNIPFIKDRISITHKAFIKAVGQMPDKIAADHHFALQRMETRIQSILKCFVELGIIDDIIKGPKEDGSTRSVCYFHLIKKGYDQSVYVFIDGHDIAFSDCHAPKVGTFFEDSVVIPKVNFETYNWVEFADKLLQFIHKIIYARKKSYEAKIFEGD